MWREMHGMLYDRGEPEARAGSCPGRSVQKRWAACRGMNSNAMTQHRAFVTGHTKQQNSRRIFL
jgi:hypothetical protein